jgi:putative transcriptional regulator
MSVDPRPPKEDTMSELGDDILKSLNEAIAYAKGDTDKAVAHEIDVETPDIRAVRAKLEMSQPEFAATFGFNLHTLRGWEQGRRRPDRATSILLRVIENDPESVVRAIHDLDEKKTRRA